MKKLYFPVYAGLMAAALLFLSACVEEIKFASPQAVQQEVVDTSNLSATASKYRSSNIIYLTWDPINEAAAYWIYVFSSETQTTENVIPRVMSSENISWDVDVTNYGNVRKLYFVIEALDTVGNVLTTSARIEGRVLQTPSVQNAGMSFYYMTLFWTPIEGATHYKIRRRAASEPDFTDLVTYRVGDMTGTLDGIYMDGAGNFGYKDASLTPETDYTYEISAQVLDQDGALVGEAPTLYSQRTPVQDAPNAPNNFAVSYFSYASKVVLAWNDPDPLTGMENKPLKYNVYRKARSESPFDYKKIASALTVDKLNPPAGFSAANISANLGSDVRVYEDKKVDAGGAYDYKVVALYDTGGEGRESSAVSGGTIPTPTGLNLTYDSATGMVLTWAAADLPAADPSGIVKLNAEIQRSIGSLAFTTINSDALITEGTYIDAKQYAQAEYKYRVRFVASIGGTAPLGDTIGAFSDEVSYDNYLTQENGGQGGASGQNGQGGNGQVNVNGGGGQAQKSYITLSMSNNGIYTLEFFWSVDPNFYAGRTFTEGDFEIQGISDTDGSVLEQFSVSDVNAFGFNPENRKGSATWLVDTRTFKPKLYRIRMRVGENMYAYSRAVAGDLFRAFTTPIRVSDGASKSHITVAWDPAKGAQSYSIGIARVDASGKAIEQYRPYKIVNDEGVETAQILPQNNNEGEQSVNVVPPNNDDVSLRGVLYSIKVLALGRTVNDVRSSDPALGSTFGPAGMRVSASKGTSISSITVTWTPARNAKNYLIVRKTKGSSAEVEIATVPHDPTKTSYSYEDRINAAAYVTASSAYQLNPTPATQAVLDGLIDPLYSRVYEYRVIPQVTPADQAALDAVEGYIVANPAPATLKATRGSYGDKIVISWKDVPGALWYEVSVSGTGNANSFSPIGTVNSAKDVTPGSDMNFEYYPPQSAASVGQVQYFKVRAMGANFDTGGKMISSAIDKVRLMGPSWAALVQAREPGPSAVVSGKTLGMVINVRASDAWLDPTDDSKSKDIYLASQGAAYPTYSYTEDSFFAAQTGLAYIHRLSDTTRYATKITWDGVDGAQKYYIYRMDPNELTNYWKKIGERSTYDSLSFFDADSLILRDHRALYWVVAVSSNDAGKTWITDASVEGDPNAYPKNKLTSTAFASFPAFDQWEETARLNAMAQASNVDVGNRMITAREYTNWAMYVIGEAIRQMSPNGSGNNVRDHDGWSSDVNFSLTNYSIRSNAYDDRSKADPSTELVATVSRYNVTTLGWGPNSTGVGGSRHETNPDAALVALLGMRLGMYFSDREKGIDNDILVNSPYGKANFSLSNVAWDFRFGNVWIHWKNRDDMYVVPARYKASGTWDFFGVTGFYFDKSKNTGPQGPANPYVSIIGFNRGYADVLNAVYGSSR